MFPGSIGYQELVVIAAVAVVLFGGRLPEVARSLGQSYQQFRKGLAEIQSTITAEPTPTTNKTTYSDTRIDTDEDEYGAPSSPRFEPPPAPGKEVSSDASE